MDDIDFFSSEDQNAMTNQSVSDEGRETATTDNDQKCSRKTKNIKKNYEPIRDGSIFLKFEDDPAEYKKLRKKIQNRESAARIRGRKKGTVQTLQIQVKKYKQTNSELLLKNATLQTENKALKNEIQFLRTLVKSNNSNNQIQENIEQYLNIGPSHEQIKPEQIIYESPFQSDSSANWVRSTAFNGTFSNWATLFVLTVALCAFVLPPQDSNATVVAQQVQISPVSHPYFLDLSELLLICRTVTKVLLIGIYLWFTVSFIYGRYWGKKLKKI